MTNYKKGYNFEREICNSFPNSILATRTAGSHSPVDCLIVLKDEIKFIQAKTSVKTILNDRLRKNKELSISNLTKYDSDIYKLQKIPTKGTSISRELWVKEFRRPILKFKI
jgi:hypothetical protein